MKKDIYENAEILFLFNMELFQFEMIPATIHWAAYQLVL